jgi:hypothetical protein
MNVAALALGARSRPSRPKGNLPPVLAITALKLSLVGHFNLSTSNLERLGVGQGVGNLPVRRFQNPTNGLARNTHALGGFLLVEPLEVGESDGFVLVDGHSHDLYRAQGDTSRLEERTGRFRTYLSTTEWPGHRHITPSLEFIISICP